MLPALLDVFVNSALVPASNRASPDQALNEPISEHEIRAVFQNPVFELPAKISGQTPIRGYRGSSGRSREGTPSFKLASSAVSTPSAPYARYANLELCGENISVRFCKSIDLLNNLIYFFFYL